MLDCALAKAAARVGLNALERRVASLTLDGTPRDELPARLALEPAVVDAAIRVICARLELHDIHALAAELRRHVRDDPDAARCELDS